MSTLAMTAEARMICRQIVNRMQQLELDESDEWSDILWWRLQKALGITDEMDQRLTDLMGDLTWEAFGDDDEDAPPRAPRVNLPPPTDADYGDMPGRWWKVWVSDINDKPICADILWARTYGEVSRLMRQRHELPDELTWTYQTMPEAKAG
ncbi:hypothetical protein [Caenispirillum bisanense]|uniref:hypothetical protein n=1 Tax=Caenispirillum bisanense TaxID=414052 RepID=UPI0031DB5183